MTDFNMPPGVPARDIPGQDDDATGGFHPITDQWSGLAGLMMPNAVVVGAALARSLESDLAAANDEIARLRAEVEALRAGTPWPPIEGQVEPAVRPRAWVLPIPSMAGGGDLLRGSPTADRPEAWEPLYDKAALYAVVLAEREACAKVCEAISDQHSWDRRSANLAQACRDAIRAMGAATTAATAPAIGE